MNECEWCKNLRLDYDKLQQKLSSAQREVEEARSLHDDAVKEHDECCARSAELLSALEVAKRVMTSHGVGNILVEEVLEKHNSGKGG